MLLRHLPRYNGKQIFTACHSLISQSFSIEYVNIMDFIERNWNTILERDGFSRYNELILLMTLLWSYAQCTYEKPMTLRQICIYYDIPTDNLKGLTFVCKPFS